MENETFGEMRKRVLRERKRSIVRSALNGRKLKGRGLVLVRLAETRAVHLSYLTLDALTQLQKQADPEDHDYRAMLIDKLSSYHPDSEIPVVVTDGKSRQYSLGVRQV
jgi:hypothetical protein